MHGDLDTQGTCAVPQTIAAGGTYSCQFDASVTGNAGDSETDTVTASGQDDDGNAVSDDDDAVVEIDDVASAMHVVKTAGTAADGDIFHINEPGGTVTFYVTVYNDSTVDSITIDTLTDDVHGDVTLLTTTCTLPQTIVAGDSYACTFDASVTGDPGDTETDTVTASGQDDDGNAVSDDDDAVVEIDDVASAMHVVKTAGTAADGDIFHINEPGGTVTFYVTVYNDSTVDSITIDTLTDDVHGDLDTQGTCAVPQTIAAGGTYSCQFDASVTGNAGDSETDTVTASGQDDDGNAVSDDDDAVVEIDDVASAMHVVKTAGTAADGATFHINEPGGTVTFYVTVYNDSTVDSITIDTLTTTCTAM